MRRKRLEEGLVLEGVTGFAVSSFVGEEERVVVWYLTEEQDVYSLIFIIIFKTVCVFDIDLTLVQSPDKEDVGGEDGEEVGCGGKAKWASDPTSLSPLPFPSFPPLLPSFQRSLHPHCPAHGEVSGCD